jgi:hypothetical protein
MVTRWDRYVVDERATNEVARPSSELQGCRSKLGLGDEQPVEQQDWDVRVREDTPSW